MRFLSRSVKISYLGKNYCSSRIVKKVETSERNRSGYKDHLDSVKSSVYVNNLLSRRTVVDERKKLEISNDLDYPNKNPNGVVRLNSFIGLVHITIYLIVGKLS